MTPPCDAPVSDDDLLDYWIHAIDGRTPNESKSIFSRAPRARTIPGHGDAWRRTHRARAARTYFGDRLALPAQSHAARWRPRAAVFVSPGERVPCAAFPMTTWS